MENDKRTPAELVADLMLEPGFVLVLRDRYEELVRAETERDVLEANITGESKYSVSYGGNPRGQKPSGSSQGRRSGAGGRGQC